MLNYTFPVSQTTKMKFRINCCQPYLFFHVPVSRRSLLRLSRLPPIILWPQSISNTSEIIAHQAAGLWRAATYSRSGQKNCTRLLHSPVTFRILSLPFYFPWLVCFLWRLFPCPSTQEAADPGPGPLMHGLPWHFYNTSLTNFTVYHK
jgi:hypothetical protein